MQMFPEFSYVHGMIVYIQATLWSKVFKNELELGHNEDAYTAMLSNPDKDR